ncbi:MAG TPA: TetR/AcrR family transcriptional regulator [Bacteroidales bacterium]|nr:TetR/AcrR family transcriptional regulator [Bacteroidales bacterium]
MNQSEITKTESDILERVRELFFKYGVRSVSMDDICRDLGVSKKKLYLYFKSKHDLVMKLLELERKSFEIIFDTYNFEGVNAIDILLTVSKEVGDHFWDVSPSMTFDLKKYYPEVYHTHVDERIEFIYQKIKINLEKGINQGMYRDDLSIELVARLYIRRLMDLHNPEFFPADKFSFQTLFDVMFDNFIRGIANQKGMEYYDEQKRKVNFNNFN